MSLNDKKPTFLSLFSGCGGFDQGFEDNGYESIGAFDNDPAVLEVYQNNLKGPTYLHDLSNHTLPVDYSSINLDVLVSGSPCQGFSTAGLRDLNDPRNKLLLVGGSIAKILSPKVIVCENVMGSLSGAHKIYWEKLVQDLTELDYNMDFLECCASDFGLAQLRKRVFLIAWKGKKIALPKLGNSPKKNLKDVLKNVADAPNHNHLIPIKDNDIFKLVKKIKSGQKLCNVRGGYNAIHTWDIPEVFGEVTNDEKEVLNLIKALRRQIRIRDFGDADPVLLSDIQSRCNFPVKKLLDRLLAKDFLRLVDGKYDIKHAYNGLYKRLEWNKCSMTVDTRFGNPRYFLHPEEHRGFTVREAARIQGFKDNFIFKGSVTKQFKMIGNAVPPPIASEIAACIKDNLL